MSKRQNPIPAVAIGPPGFSKFLRLGPNEWDPYEYQTGFPIFVPFTQ
ncbi:hypothetical protein P872_14070 [Rhodonellum psychrophilum GCM71 = DSM 17998]|uniref:Uncharacterized protein n=1 Tax=Rhodonellum psychrophilum GCM71 = DSM 17998 TaxID=1123057 RepID=U5BUH0_9BACT|nr:MULTISPECIES: hypothetical protein [Rhodonellum]ERM80231.1 hypothetical protein P872_14070 [Rhodonellum psychrophilum GCM71 = DSM 17998]